jgi:hypothetical protein
MPEHLVKMAILPKLLLKRYITMKTITFKNVLPASSKSAAGNIQRANRLNEITSLLVSQNLPESFDFNGYTFNTVVELATSLDAQLDGMLKLAKLSHNKLQTTGTTKQGIVVTELCKDAPATSAEVTKNATSEEVTRAAIETAIHEQVSNYHEFLKAIWHDALSNPAQFNADYIQLGKVWAHGKVQTVGVKADDLPKFMQPLELPTDRIKALISSEQNSAGLALLVEDVAKLTGLKPINPRVVNDSLACDVVNLTDDHKNDLRFNGYTVTIKDNSVLSTAMATAISSQDFAKVGELAKELMALNNTMQVSKLIA